jgi:hypothetical protein
MTEESREWLEAEALRCARKVPGCEHLTQVVIKRSEEGTGQWHVAKFTPNLPHNLTTVARATIIRELAGKYLLMGKTPPAKS